jgi:phosphatidylinositol kinase/protein kinase (PI-3  family)
VAASDRLEVMGKGLTRIKFPEPLQLPLSPMFQVATLNIPKCRFMDSKKLPLWLGFVNADSDGDELKVIFKEGDDLRQDMLTLQMLRIMDRMWRNHGLDMQMSPYGW